MASDEFYNPYQFIPLGKAEKWKHDYKIPLRAEFDGSGFKETRLSHAAYKHGLLHGRILCRLSLVDPIFIGADRGQANKDDYTRVEPYTIGGEPAIPASSLRGLISSLAEAASGSALRVLDDKKPVSYRMPPRKALSAIGCIRETADGLRLQPLIAPTIVRRNGSADARKFLKWHKLFGGRFPLRMALGNYKYRNKQSATNAGKEPFFNADFRDTLSVENYDNSFPRRTPVYFMRALEYIPFNEGGEPQDATERVDTRDIKDRSKNVIGQMVIGQLCTDESEQKTDCARILVGEQAGYIRGFIRVLGGQDRDMAETKKHEIFIPFSEEAERNRPTLPISRYAIENFKALAREAAEAVKNDLKKEGDKAKRLRMARPYLPFGPLQEMRADRQSMTEDGVWEPNLRDGQLVFFDIEEQDGKAIVTAISFSSIWRGLVETKEGGIASTWDFFRKHERDGHEGELLPFNSKRETISPAEAMFGFVSADPSKTGQRGAYAGRVRLSAAQLAQPVPENERKDLFCQDDTPVPTPEDPPGPNYVKLKILSSPKSPSPAMYFRPDGNAPVAKHDLNVKHEPNGRKVYLHRDPTLGKPWKTEHPDKDENQKNAIRPLNPTACNDRGGFWFHVDFDNLSEAELDLLCFALSPSDAFRHKLGMGKPIGLGAVHIEPVALLQIDRKKRCGNLFGERYGDVSTVKRVADLGVLQGSRYARELHRIGSAQHQARLFRDRADRHAGGGMPPDVLKAILLTGEPETLGNTPVHYPRRRDQADNETETFKWFVANAHNKADPPAQSLSPISELDKKLKPLKKNWAPTKG